MYNQKVPKRALEILNTKMYKIQLSFCYPFEFAYFKAASDSRIIALRGDMRIFRKEFITQTR